MFYALIGRGPSRHAGGAPRRASGHLERLHALQAEGRLLLAGPAAGDRQPRRPGPPVRRQPSCRRSSNRSKPRARRADADPYVAARRLTPDVARSVSVPQGAAGMMLARMQHLEGSAYARRLDPVKRLRTSSTTVRPASPAAVLVRREGGHFRVRIVGPAFARSECRRTPSRGLLPLGALTQTGIHALHRCPHSRVREP